MARGRRALDGNATTRTGIALTVPVTMPARHTHAQESESLAAARDMWRAWGTSCAPADRPRAEEAIAGLYHETSRGTPEFLWVPSPHAGLEMTIARVGSGQRTCTEWIRQARWTHLCRGLEEACSAQIDADVRDTVHHRVRREMGEDLATRLEEALFASCWAQLNREFTPVRHPDTSDDPDPHPAPASPRHPSPGLGQFGGRMVAEYLWLRDSIGVRYDEDDSRTLDRWADIARSCGPWWAFENVVIVSERPVELRVDDAGQLRGGPDPAIRYPDGWGVHA